MTHTAILALLFTLIVSLPNALCAQTYPLTQRENASFYAEAVLDRALSAPAENVPAVPVAEKPDLAASLAQTIARVISDSTQDITAGEKLVIAYFGRAYEAGVLDKTIVAVLNVPELQSLLPQAVAANKQQAAGQLSAYIGAELEMAGVVPGISGAESWANMSARHLKLAQASAYKPRSPGQASLFSESGFVAEFSALIGMPFTGGNAVRFLVNGPASFSERERLIKSAKKSIHILTWAVYDDETGRWALELLAAKKREGLDVKIMVDGKTSALHGKDILPLFSQAGIEVARFQDNSRKYDGLHAKVMIVDGETAVAGGMNFGNDYSHIGNGPKWRDTDVLVTGPAIAQFNSLFAALWNKQAGGSALSLTAAQAAGASGNSMVSVILQSPGQESYIMLGILKAIYGASSRINIENAYLIMMPALKTAIMDALARGVRVNVYTNSRESIDEPVMSVPILKSLPDLLNAGAGVYLKKGDTLHSKFLTVDGVFCNIGSFNLHPRSIRYENETLVNILDRQKTGELDTVFYNDIAQAQEITKPEQLNIPASVPSDLIARYLFNQL